MNVCHSTGNYTDCTAIIMPVNYKNFYVITQILCTPIASSTVLSGRPLLIKLKVIKKTTWRHSAEVCHGISAFCD